MPNADVRSFEDENVEIAGIVCDFVNPSFDNTLYVQSVVPVRLHRARDTAVEDIVIDFAINAFPINGQQFFVHRNNTLHVQRIVAVRLTHETNHNVVLIHRFNPPTDVAPGDAFNFAIHQYASLR